MDSLNDGKLFYVVTIAFAVGIAVRSFYSFGLAEIAWLGIVALALSVVPRHNGKALLVISLAIFCFALGAFRLEWASRQETNPVLESQVGQTVDLSGVIVREPEERPSSTHLYVETDNGLVLVTALPGQDWRYGDRVVASGQLKKPEPFETDLGRTFNYRGYLLTRGVSYMMSGASVEKVAEGEASSLIRHIFTAKQAFMTKIETLIPEPQAGLAEGLLLGVKRALGEELESTFRRTGIIHIVVLSGYNVMLVVCFILFVFRNLLGNKVSVWLGLGAICLFAIMVGLSATVVRASLMAALLLIVGMTGRIYLVLRGLVLAGVLMLLWNPYSLVYDVGFQLSFLATLGLILVSPHLEKRLQVVPSTLHIREFLIATLATQIFVLPILLYQMGEFSLIAVVVNVLVLPAVPLAMLLTFLTGLVAFLSSTLATLLAFLTYIPLWYIIAMAEWFGALPFASFTVPAFPFWLVTLSYVVIALVLWGLAPELKEQATI